METKTNVWWEAQNSGWGGVDEDGEPLSWFNTSNLNTVYGTITDRKFSSRREAVECNHNHSLRLGDDTIFYRVVRVTTTREIYTQ